MTMFKCHCGEVHDSAVQSYCPITLTLGEATYINITPKTVGAEIRRLLMSLRASEHTLDDERAGHMSYGTDELRMQALDYAGICWLAPGEMAPGCCCDWSTEKPEGQRLQLAERMQENNKLWADDCITRDHATATCARGTAKCVVKHRGGVG